MSEKRGVISYALQIYTAALLTIIALFLFFSYFNISIETKGFSDDITPSVEISNNSGVDLEKERTAQLIRAKENRDDLSNHCSVIATAAQRYYRKAKNKGGGGLSFIGYEFDENFRYTETGTYTVKVESKEKLVIVGIGIETGKDQLNPVKVECIVNPVVIQTNNLN